MAITIEAQPQDFTTLDLCLFKITSNRANLQSFKVELIDSNTNTVMTVQKYFTLPFLINGTSFDLSKILKSFVSEQIERANDILLKTNRVCRIFKLRITELYILSGNVTEGSQVTTGDFRIINAEIGRFDFSMYNFRNYVATSDGVKCVFLSNKPLESNLFKLSEEYLYFATKIVSRVKFSFYNRKTGLVATHIITGVTDANVYRINISPYLLAQTFDLDLKYPDNSEFTERFSYEFGNDILNPKYASYFTVELIDLDGNTVSEVRTFYLLDEPCNRFVQMFFVNNLGGLDSLFLEKPKQTISVNKTQIDANTYQYDTLGNYVDNKNGIFNPDKITISSKKENTFSAVSDVLSDKIRPFSKGVFESENVFVKIKSGMFLPVTIDPTSYELNRLKFDTNSYRLSLSFKINGEVNIF